MRVRQLFLGATLAAVSAFGAVAYGHYNRAPESVSVRLIAFNDFHGNIDPTGTVSVPDPSTPGATIREPVGGAAYFATAVQQLKQDSEYNIVVGAGDMVGASPLDSALFHDEPTIEALNRIGLDFSSVGNHEFDKGSAELKRLQYGGCYPGGVVGQDTCLLKGRFPGARFNYLAANVINDSTGRPLFPGYGIKTFHVGHGKTVRVGFIGLVLKETPTIVTPAGVEGLSFEDEATTANNIASKLKRQGVNAIVVLIHQGIFTSVPFDDKSCAGANGDLLPILDKLDPSIKLVVSGHTHVSYICQGQGTTNTNVFYTSAGSYGRYVSAIDMNIDVDSDTITSISADNKLVVNDTQTNPAPTAYPTLTANSNVAQLVAQYDTAAAPLTNQIVGSITADITRTAAASGESNLGDIIADAQLDATQADNQQAVIAFMNPGGIRADLQYSQISGGEQPGQVTYGEAFNVQPFGNSLVTLTLTGAQIYTLLGQQWVGQTSPRFLQVSRGFSFAWDNSLPDGTSKIIDGSVTLNGQPIDKAASYRVTVNSFLASGGDNFKVLTSGTNNVGGAQDIDAFRNYLTAHSPLSPSTSARYTRVN